jgi:hypothetical protein
MSHQLSANPSTSQTSISVNHQISQCQDIERINNNNNNNFDQKTNSYNLNTIAGKRNALNINNNNNNNNNRVNKRLRIDCEESDCDLNLNNKMSENTIALNNNQNNRFSVSPNGVTKSAQLANNTKPGTGKKLIIKNFGESSVSSLLTLILMIKIQ